ncbi:hypothetical protein [Paracoccus methylovorus]|uniref:hypothetical protein n=1 Tax=Paracoccus methylovorus TaxID=2812658 RepID=UPI00389947C8
MARNLISVDEQAFFKGFIRSVWHPNGRKESNHLPATSVASAHFTASSLGVGDRGGLQSGLHERQFSEAASVYCVNI